LQLSKNYFGIFKAHVDGKVKVPKTKQIRGIQNSSSYGATTQDTVLGNNAGTAITILDDDDASDDNSKDEKNDKDTDDEEKLTLNQRLLSQMAHNLNTLNGTLRNFVSHSTETTNSTNTLLQSIANQLKKSATTIKKYSSTSKTSQLVTGDVQSDSVGGDGQSDSADGDGQSDSVGGDGQSDSADGDGQSDSVGGDGQSDSVGDRRTLAERKELEKSQGEEIDGEKKIDSILIDHAQNSSSKKRRSFQLVDTAYDTFKNKMNEYLAQRIPVRYQNLNFQQMRDEEGPNLGSVLNQIDSKLLTLEIFLAFV
jgi:hypothetical protein